MEHTDRATVRRLPKRGLYDRSTINSILDEGLVCHVGLCVDGQPVVIPMAYGRDGERLILHGSAASRLMSNLAAGVDACVTVTLLDGLVLARSQFHHSMNYRSVVAFGRARAIEGTGEKLEALRALVEHLVPGRAEDSRPSSQQELDATAVLEFPLDECSAKIRTGPAVDARADLGLGYWAGIVPLSLEAGMPIAAADLDPGTALPDYVAGYERSSAPRRARPKKR